MSRANFQPDLEQVTDGVITHLETGGADSVTYGDDASDVHTFHGNVTTNGDHKIVGRTTLTGDYVNFSATAGASGFGIRSDGGAMQFKSASGTWQNIGTGGGVNTNTDYVWGGDHLFQADVDIGNSVDDTLTITAGVDSSILPSDDNTHSLGSEAKRWANIYTGDLHLKNDRGNWTIQEESDYLCVINNNTGQKFKMVLEPIT